jgi:hypothetical protein
MISALLLALITVAGSAQKDFLNKHLNQRLFIDSNEYGSGCKIKCFLIH